MTVNVGDAQKQQVSEGITMTPIGDSLADGQVSAALFEFEPGASYGQEIHGDDIWELLYVVEGVFNDGKRNYPADSLIQSEPASMHVPCSPTGCKIVAFNVKAKKRAAAQ